MTALPVPCGNLLCKHFAECKTNAIGFKECVCPKACSFAAIQPICGKDMRTGKQITYPSMCFLKIRSCRLQRSVVPIRLDRCGECCVIFVGLFVKIHLKVSQKRIEVVTCKDVPIRGRVGGAMPQYL